jgi:hypothetical protein
MVIHDLCHNHPCFLIDIQPGVTENLRAGRCFIILIDMRLFCGYSIFVFETAAVSLAWKLFSRPIQFIGITFIPAILFFLVREFTNRRVSGDNWFVVLIYPHPDQSDHLSNPCITGSWEKPIHHQQQHPFPVVDFDYQWWFYTIHAPYLRIPVGGQRPDPVDPFDSKHERGIRRIQSRYLLVAILSACRHGYPVCGRHIPRTTLQFHHGSLQHLRIDTLLLFIIPFSNSRSAPHPL